MATTHNNPTTRLPLGQLLITRGAMAVLNPADVERAIGRHESGDWGDVCDQDKSSNDEAVRNGDRLLSSYRDSDGVVFWVITEWDRSATTVLLPDEY
jgi:hypothetical protein